MAEMDEKLGSLLNDPEKMKQIMDMASSLMGKMGGAPSAPSTTAPEPTPSTSDAQTSQVADILKSFMDKKAPDDPAVSPASGLGSGGIASALPGILQMFGGGAAVKSEKATLLSAIKPYVATSRAGNIDRAIKMANMAKSAKSALGSFLPK